MRLWTTKRVGKVIHMETLTLLMASRSIDKKPKRLVRLVARLSTSQFCILLLSLKTTYMPPIIKMTPRVTKTSGYLAASSAKKLGIG